jgi:hypothetical protein
MHPPIVPGKRNLIFDKFRSVYDTIPPDLELVILQANTPDVTIQIIISTERFTMIPPMVLKHAFLT